MTHQELRETARGRWAGILEALGLPGAFLNGRHQPCPICGGIDRARWDNKDGYGTYFCNGCGAGDGFGLIMKFHGWDYKTAAQKIRPLVGVMEKREAEKRDPKADLRAMASRWRSSTAIGDQVKTYLKSRGIENLKIDDIRQYNFEMVNLVRAADGSPCQVHRTLLTADGKKRTDVDKAKMLMRGPWPKGSAVRLAQSRGGHLGIAEGIETALSATALFCLPCWAALSSSILETWEPPDDVENVTIFGDNDINFAGQRAAYQLAHKLSVRKVKIDVSVCIPKKPGDWNDVLCSERKCSSGDPSDDGVEPDCAGSS